MEFKRSRRGIGVVATSVAIASLGALFLAAPASAATTSPHGAVTPQISCGWTPARDTGAIGNFTGDGVNIRSGPGTDCGVVAVGYSGDFLDVRCGFYNNTDGRWWDYLTDYTQGVTGWSADYLVQWSGAPETC